MNQQDKNHMGGHRAGEEKREHAGRPGQHQQGGPDKGERKDDMRRQPQQGERDPSERQREQR